MALTQSTKEQMLRELTCRPFDIDHSVIYFPKSHPIHPKLPAFRKHSRGSLDVLPPELLSLIFIYLDFQSLGALRCTCFGIKIESRQFWGILICCPAVCSSSGLSIFWKFSCYYLKVYCLAVLDALPTFGFHRRVQRKENALRGSMAFTKD